MRSRGLFISVVFAVGLVLTLNQHSRVTRSQAEVAKMMAEVSALEDESNAWRDEIRTLHEELRREQLALSETRIREAKAKAEIARLSPDARWTEPPETSPEWSPESPFVWVSKELLTQLPMEPFSENGELSPGVAEVLGIDNQSRKDLAELMAGQLARFREAELDNVYLSTNHLPGVSHIEGKKMTIELRPPADVGAQFQHELTTALTTKLGAQRAGIIMAQGKAWFAKNVSLFAAEPKVISVGWRPANGYSLTIKGPGMWKSIGGISDLKGHVPGHLLPYFGELAETAKE